MYYAVLLYLDVLEEPGGHLEELDHLKYLMFKNHFHWRKLVQMETLQRFDLTAHYKYS